MPRRVPTEKQREEFMKMMNEMMAARFQMLADNATKYAEALGAVRAALVKSGFSREESMQIVLMVAQRQGRGPMFMGGHGPWHGKER
jgi:hypothetical protein